MRDATTRRQSKAIPIALFAAAIFIGVGGVAMLEQLPCQDRWDVRLFSDCFSDPAAIAAEQKTYQRAN